MEEVNDIKTLFEYDACKFINENLEDGQSVFVKGTIEYSTYDNKRNVKFIPNQISLCKSVDFENENFKEISDFKQRIVFMGIEQNDDKKTFTVLSKITGYNSIEDAEFKITNGDLAKQFKKNLKPYTTIDVWGKVSTFTEIEKVETSDIWGEESEMDKVSTPTKRELIIIGADPKSIDKDVLSESVIEEAIKKLNASKKAKEDFNDNDSWGSASTLSKSKVDEEEDDDVWN